MYSFRCGDHEIKKAKGITKTVVKKHIQFESYKSTLFENKAMKSKIHCLRSHDHQVYLEGILKTSLSCFDDKRYLLENGVDSLAYGHYKLHQRDK